jgi:hypothetical protein
VLRWARATVELAVVVVFLLLLYQNAELKRRATTTRARLDRFAAGDTLPTIKVVDKSGKLSTLELRATRTLLLIGDPSCPSCQTHLQALGADAIILSTADLATTRASSFWAFPGAVYSLAAPPSDVRFRRVPQVVVVDSRRIVRTCAEPRDCL